jgi:hemolysin III
MQYSQEEEFLSYLIHGIGALLSLVGTLYYMHVSRTTDAFTSSVIFGGSLFALYSCSTLYHYIDNKGVKKIFQKLDHSAIFILIAGSYTPFMLLAVGGTKGYTIVIINWALALIGIALEFQTKFRPKIISMLLYVTMGWIALIYIKTIFLSLSTEAFILMVAGGVLYTGGISVYLMKKIKYTHAFWHLFVLTGSACHYFSVLLILFQRA